LSLGDADDLPSFALLFASQEAGTGTLSLSSRLVVRSDVDGGILGVPIVLARARRVCR